MALSGHLVARGYAVSVLTMHRTDRDFYTLDEGVQRLCLGLAGQNRGIRKIYANLERVAALRRVIREQDPDVVIGMMTSAAVFAILACLGLRTRVVAAERNFPGRKAIEPVWQLLRTMSYHFAAAHVAQTRECADWLVRHARARNVHVIPNSVTWPVPGVSPRTAPDEVLESDAPIVLAVGDKPRQKGFDLLVDAFAGASAGKTEWRLVILGLDDSTCREVGTLEALRARMQTLGISERVTLPGRVGNVSDWYERADIYVLSSRYEGFPNSLLEAMAGGCPSVAFDCDAGPRDIIEDGVNGLLVPAESPEALSQALNRLMDDRRLRDRLGKAAVVVRERYSEERIFGRWRQVIEGVMEGQYQASSLRGENRG